MRRLFVKFFSTLKSRICDAIFVNFLCLFNSFKRARITFFLLLLRKLHWVDNGCFSLVRTMYYCSQMWKDMCWFHFWRLEFVLYQKVNNLQVTTLRKLKYVGLGKKKSSFAGLKNKNKFRIMNKSSGQVRYHCRVSIKMRVPTYYVHSV